MIKILHQHFLESNGISTDTRKIEKGQLFFALKGDNFNGNTYAEKALKNGASYAIIDDGKFVKNERYILVDNVLNTLQDLSKFHRNHLAIKIIALTGSNGKTTTKELINAVLSRKFKTVATKGNLNNHIGVPLTLLSMTSETEIGIVEMGANHLGEIKMLCEIAQPDYGLITNFGKAHLEGFGSVEGVVKGKSELYDYLKANDGLIFTNSDDAKQMALTQKTERISFGNTPHADIKTTFLKADPFVKLEFGNTTINSQLIGVYNAQNIASAIAVGRYFKVPAQVIKKAVEHYAPANNRSQIIERNGNTIILDAYNANPSSMSVALKNLEQLKALKKIAVLGDMFELGEVAEQEHQLIAEMALNSKLDTVILVGGNFNKVQLSSEENFKKFKSTEDLIVSKMFKQLKAATILIKGSRGMALEQLLEKL